MRSDLIVVGGGLCGTLAARHLAEAGKRVVLVEAGPSPRGKVPSEYASFMRATRPLTHVDPRRWAYRGPKGYEWHRVRAMGGRTLLWGGWMMRPTRDYFAWRKSIDAAWPTELEALDGWVRRAEAHLEVKQGARGVLHRKLSKLGLHTLSKREAVLPKGRRMLTALDLKPPRVTRGAVLSFEQTAEGVKVHLEGGRTLASKALVLAASPVETARIVEASRGRAARRRIPYADHLLSGVICIVDRQPSEPHPVGAPDQSAVVPTAPEAKHRFTLEVRGPAPLEHLDPDDVKALGFTPKTALTKSFYVVFAMGETDAQKPRVVELDARSPDALGRPSPRFVKRRHTPAERALAVEMNATCARLGRELAGPGSAMIMIYDALDYGSGGHETGTCVDLVDGSGALREFPRVYLADGASVPAATDGHPSLTLAANALRVANSALRHA